MPTSTPSAVAAPLPPAKRKNTGHRCPTNAASPTLAAQPSPRPWGRPNSSTSATGNQPLSASSSSVTTPPTSLPQRHARRNLAAGAQHIGRAGVLAAIGARIAQAHEPRHDDRERQRAQQVGGHGGKYGIQGGQNDSLGIHGGFGGLVGLAGAARRHARQARLHGGMARAATAAYFASTVLPATGTPLLRARKGV